MSFFFEKFAFAFIDFLHSHINFTIILCVNFVCLYMHMCCQLWLFVIPWTIAHQVPLSIEFSRQEYWSEQPFPTARGSSQPRDLTHLMSLHWQADFFFFYQLSHLGSPQNVIICQILLWFCRLILWEVEVKVKWKYKSLSPVLVFATPWTIQSMKFSRPEYQSG